MVLKVSPQFQAIKRGPRRQVRWRTGGFGRLMCAWNSMEIKTFKSFFAYFPKNEFGALRSAR